MTRHPPLLARWQAHQLDQYGSATAMKPTSSAIFVQDLKTGQKTFLTDGFEYDVDELRVVGQ